MLKHSSAMTESDTKNLREDGGGLNRKRDANEYARCLDARDHSVYRENPF